MRSTGTINGRGERIRTSDSCVPNAVLYQAELHPVFLIWTKPITHSAPSQALPLIRGGLSPPLTAEGSLRSSGESTGVLLAGARGGRKGLEFKIAVSRQSGPILTNIAYILNQPAQQWRHRPTRLRAALAGG